MSPASDRPTRQRLDQLLVERGLAETRTRAQALIMGGHVRVGEGDSSRTDRKSGDMVANTIALEVEAPPPFVSRGGLKLRAALDVFGVEPVGLVCLDVGSSTGGFTDLLLQRDASRVYAVDAGRGQLADALLHDPRVVSMERTNARGLGPGVLPTFVDMAVVDVSFISLDRILRPVASCFGPKGGRIVALVKPQFEAGRKLNKDGVIRDPKVHLQTLEAVARYALGIGLKLRNAIASPLTGPAGNREFFLELEVPDGYVPTAASGPVATSDDVDPDGTDLPEYPSLAVAYVELPAEWSAKFAELAGA